MGLVVPGTLKCHQNRGHWIILRNTALPQHTPILCILFLFGGESASQTDTAPLAVADTHFGGIETVRHLTTFTTNENNTKWIHKDGDLIIQCQRAPTFQRQEFSEWRNEMVQGDWIWKEGLPRKRLNLFETFHCKIKYRCRKTT